MNTPRKRLSANAGNPCSITVKSQDFLVPEAADALEPGLLRVFVAGKSRAEAIAVGAEPLVLGRTHPLLADVPDQAMSRRHASLCLRGGQFQISDLGSQNGSELDGQPLATAGQALVSAPAKKVPAAPLAHRAALSREQVEQVMKQHAGNVAAAARALGMHRTQLRRLIARYVE